MFCATWFVTAKTFYIVQLMDKKQLGAIPAQNILKSLELISSLTVEARDVLRT